MEWAVIFSVSNGFRTHDDYRGRSHRRGGVSIVLVEVSLTDARRTQVVSFTFVIAAIRRTSGYAAGSAERKVPPAPVSS